MNDLLNYLVDYIIYYTINYMVNYKIDYKLDNIIEYKILLYKYHYYWVIVILDIKISTLIEDIDKSIYNLSFKIGHKSYIQELWAIYLLYIKSLKEKR